METQQKRGRGRLRIYDWSKWLNQQEVTLTPGVDFKCPMDSFKQQIRTAACMRQIKISVFFVEGRIVVWNHSYRAGLSESTQVYQEDSPASSTALCPAY